MASVRLSPLEHRSAACRAVSEKVQKAIARVESSGKALRPEVVQLPGDGSVCKEDWLAAHVVDFYNELAVVVCSEAVVKSSKQYQEPGEGFPPHWEYRWPGKDGRAVRMTGPQYALEVMRWIPKLAKRKFPSSSGSYPADFEEGTCKPIFKRMFRVFAILYHRHFDAIEEQADTTRQLNGLFEHFMFFAAFEFSLIEARELEPLKGAVRTLRKRFRALRKNSKAGSKRIDMGALRRGQLGAPIRMREEEKDQDEDEERAERSKVRRATALRRAETLVDYSSLASLLHDVRRETTADGRACVDVVEAIIELEVDLGNKARTLRDGYMLPALTALEADAHARIFVNVESISRFSEFLSAEAQITMQGGRDAAAPDSVEALVLNACRTISSYIGFFTLYARFRASYRASLAALKHSREEATDFRRLLAKQESQHGVSLESLLGVVYKHPAELGQLISDLNVAFQTYAESARDPVLRKLELSYVRMRPGAARNQQFPLARAERALELVLASIADLDDTMLRLVRTYRTPKGLIEMATDQFDLPPHFATAKLIGSGRVLFRLLRPKSARLGSSPPSSSSSSSSSAPPASGTTSSGGGRWSLGTAYVFDSYLLLTEEKGSAAVALRVIQSVAKLVGVSSKQRGRNLARLVEDTEKNLQVVQDMLGPGAAAFPSSASELTVRVAVSKEQVQMVADEDTGAPKSRFCEASGMYEVDMRAALEGDGRRPLYMQTSSDELVAALHEFAGSSLPPGIFSGESAGSTQGRNSRKRSISRADSTQKRRSSTRLSVPRILRRRSTALSTESGEASTAISHDVFLTYHAAKSEDQTSSLFWELRSMGFRVWWDKALPQVEVGEVARSEALSASRAVIVVLTHADLLRKRVQLDLLAARRLGRPIAVLFDGGQSLNHEKELCPKELHFVLDKLEVTKYERNHERRAAMWKDVFTKLGLK